MVKNAYPQADRKMARFGALTAVLSNMENKHYTENILSKIDFLKEFTSVTKKEMNEARKLIRPNPCEPIIGKDRERKPVLEALVKLMEVNVEVPAKELKAWVASIKI